MPSHGLAIMSLIASFHRSKRLSVEDASWLKSKAILLKKEILTMPASSKLKPSILPRLQIRQATMITTIAATVALRVPLPTISSAVAIVTTKPIVLRQRRVPCNQQTTATAIRLTRYIPKLTDQGKGPHSLPWAVWGLYAFGDSNRGG